MTEIRLKDSIIGLVNVNEVWAVVLLFIYLFQNRLLSSKSSIVVS